MDNRNDSHEHAPMRFPCFYALDHKCNGLFGVLHLRIPVRDGLCNIELSARLTDPRTAHTPGLSRGELSRCEPRLHASDLVLAHKLRPKIRCYWSVWLGHNVSQIPRTRLWQCHTALEVLTFVSGLAASAVRMGTYIRITESKSLNSHQRLRLWTDPKRRRTKRHG